MNIQFPSGLFCSGALAACVIFCASQTDGATTLTLSVYQLNGDYVANSYLNYQKDFYVGYSADASLTVDSSSLYTYIFYIGYGSGCYALVDVTDSATVGCTGMYVGYAGDGDLTIEDLSYVINNGSAFVGYLANSSGYVTVIGDGSLNLSDEDDESLSYWSCSGALYLGYDGTGTLVVKRGGYVSCASADLGYNKDGYGSITVTGSTTEMDCDGNFNVGNAGTGILTISSGGIVTDQSGYIGYASGGDGTVLVSGASSEWVNSANLYVGYAGTGTLTVSNGGYVKDGNGYIGFSGSTNTVEVKGYNSTTSTASKWVNSSGLYVGYSGTGTLTISDGGYVSDAAGYIGYGGDANGTVLVTGTNSTSGTASQWICSGELLAGVSGNGTLTVENGGYVQSLTGCVGAEDGSSGTVTVSGADSSNTASQWVCNSSLIVGKIGDGTLTISDGGYVSDSSGVIGYTSGGSGTATVTGSGSEWYNSGELYVGSSGTGTLTISSGALVTATTLSIGTSGTLYINGGYLALLGADSTTDYGTLYSLIEDSKVYVIEGNSSILLSTSNYKTYVTLAYYADIKTCDVLDSYGLSGSYTVLLGYATAVPEPAAYALFGGLGALGLALLRRRK